MTSFNIIFNLLSPSPTLNLMFPEFPSLQKHNRTIKNKFANSLLVEVKLRINQLRRFNRDHKIFRFQLCNIAVNVCVCTLCFLGKNQLTMLLIQLKPRKYSGLSERLQKSDVIDSIDLEKLSLFDANLCRQIFLSRRHLHWKQIKFKATSIIVIHQFRSGIKSNINLR
jgi:hypothetical protein